MAQVREDARRIPDQACAAAPRLWRTLAEVSREQRRAFVVASGEHPTGVPLADTFVLPLQA